jgi:general secretion pathway protein K
MTRATNSGDAPFGDGEDGYAIVAAVAALAVFAAIAFAILASGRGDIADLRGEVARAKLDAAADAGLARAIQGLATDDLTHRWPIDGRARTLSFDGDRLTIVVEDERGKAPIAGLDAGQLRRLFVGAGADDDRAAKLVDAYQDWFDPDADPTRHAAETALYAARGLKPPDAAGGSVDELARLNGMDASTFARIRRALTPYFGNSGPFTPRTASPLAIATMSEAGADDPAVLERQRELAGEHPALEIADEKSMAGHAVTIAVRAEDASGDRVEHRTVVEFTGKSSPAFYIRQVELAGA